MEVSQVEDVDVTKTINSMRILSYTVLLLLWEVSLGYAQNGHQDSTKVYKKRVLETTEIDFLGSYYTQDGSNAAVTGGLGTEELTDGTGALVITMPLNDDDVLTFDAGISAYSSASSSNVNPFDGDAERQSPFDASSGASSGDVWSNLTATYSHSSDDRNHILTAKLILSGEYDYYSIGFGGGYTKLMNEKNTELSVNANLFFDTWNAIYPVELRPFAEGRDGLNNNLFTQLSGNTNYQPAFSTLNSLGRNTYALGLGFSQILSKNLQGTLLFDAVMQRGLLSTPFQRVYFSDVEDSFKEDFHLADDIERLPDVRLKMAVGGRLNYYLNELFVLRTYYRYYFDDWGIKSHTANVELPVKITDKFTLYPAYRYYNQTAIDYFAPYNQHLSTDEFYTSDYDLSAYDAQQYSFGVTYTDILTKLHLSLFGLKSVDLKYSYYKRSSGLEATIISGGCKFVMY